MAMDFIGLSVGMGYTDETVIGGGALKGKNCVVSNIEEVADGVNVTFQWTLDNGTVQTETVLLPRGTQGDAELIDARIDKDGNTHVNVGEHIRTVSSQLSSEIANANSEIDGLVYNLIETQNILKFEDLLNINEWTTGSYTDGGEHKTGNAIKTTYAKPLEKVTNIILKDKFLYSLKVIKYDVNGTYVGVVNNRSSDYKVESEGNYKIVVESKTSTEVSVDMLDNLISIEKIIENDFEKDIKRLSNNDGKNTTILDNIVTAIGDGIKGKTYKMTSQDKYNAWSFVAEKNNTIICVYSKGDNHTDNDTADIYTVSSKNGVVWSDEKEIISTKNMRDTITGIGLNPNDGYIYFWNRVGEPIYPERFELYKTYEGILFEKVSTPTFEFMTSHNGDIVYVPNVGLMCFWNTYRHNTSYFGCMISNDNGVTWEQKVIGTYDNWVDCPTEFTLAYVGNNRIIAMARSEESGAMFQVTSADNGDTWTISQTNITDVCVSTPSVIYDEISNNISIYYYDRGNGKLKMRKSNIDDVFDNPTNWGEATVIAQGTSGNDAGNVNAVRFNNHHIVTFYSGNETNTDIYDVII